MAKMDIEKIEKNIKSIDVRGQVIRKLGKDYDIDRTEFLRLREEILASDLPDTDKIDIVEKLSEHYRLHIEAYETKVKTESDAILSEKKKEIDELKSTKAALNKAKEKLSKATFQTDASSVSPQIESLNEKESYAERSIRQSELELEEFQRLASEEEAAMGCRNFDELRLYASQPEEKDNIDMSNQQYVADTLSALEDGMHDTIDREMVHAGAEVRRLRSPKTETYCGELKGKWENSVFYLDDNFVPKYKNDEKLTVAEIKQQLFTSFGIEFDGIPFANGVADFSGISVATISTKEIVMKSTGMSELEYNRMEPLERTKKLSEVFDKNRRNANFDLADKIVAERQVPIPGLGSGYTATELADWREGKFTWDEQVNGGYNLVPTIIHGNISHTGLVSSSDKAVVYFERRKDDPPTKYSWDEETAPVSIEELRKTKHH